MTVISRTFTPVKIAVARETREGEARVAMVPELVGKLTALGWEVAVEPGAGLHSLIPDEEYAACEKAAAQGYPLRMVPFMVPWVLKDLPDEGRSRMYALAGQAYRVVAVLTRRRFARRESLAFRYV